MATLKPREPVRLSLQAKLAVAREQDSPQLLLALKEYEHECLVLAQVVIPTGDAAPSWPALFMDCARDSIYGILQTEIDWAARTRRRIDEYAARAS
jgi:hypothetical protein